MSKMASFRNILFGTAVALTTLTGAAHADAPTTEFQQGLADREAWESWFNGLSGEYRSGAYFWSGQRSLPDPTSCDSLGGEASKGCYAAKARLDISDMRRKLAPAYRQGWNSYVAPAPQPAAASAPQPQQPTTVTVEQSMPAAPSPAPVQAQPAPAAPLPLTTPLVQSPSISFEEQLARQPAAHPPSAEELQERAQRLAATQAQNAETGAKALAYAHDIKRRLLSGISPMPSEVLTAEELDMGNRCKPLQLWVARLTQRNQNDPEFSDENGARLVVDCAMQLGLKF
jgi:hypothetical protein